MGFFLTDEDKAPARTVVRKVAPVKRSELTGSQGCDGCSLKELWPTLASPIMKIKSNPFSDILVLSGHPSKDGDMKGEPFDAEYMSIMRKMVPPRELSRCAWQNVARCHGSKEPTIAEAYQCAPFLVQDIEELKAPGILGLGPIPYYSLVHDLPSSEATVYTAYGLWFPVNISGEVRWFMPTFDMHILHNLDGSKPKAGWEAAPYYPLMRANVRKFFDEIDRLGKPRIHNLQPHQVVIVHTAADALDFLSHMNPTIFGVDIETANPGGGDLALRPYNRDSRLLSAALSDGERTMAFAIDHPEEQNAWALEFLINALQYCDQWVAHNAAFELAWLVWFGQMPIEPQRMHDTMAIGRLKYGRASFLNLACMSRQVLGINVKGLTNVNAARLLDYPLSEILPYNGLDAQASALIWLQEYDKFSRTDLANYERLTHAVAATTQMQLMGLPWSQETSLALKSKWEAKGREAEETAAKLYEVRSYIAQRQEEFSLSNDTQFATALVDYGRVKLPRSANGAFKTDETILLAEAADNPLVKAKLAHREASKIISTYVEPFLATPKRVVDGLIHPCYTVYLVRTFRTSSEDPNIQNQPKRANRECRSQVVAPPGHVLVAFDYGQIQVRIIGILSKDPVLCDYIIKKNDMHLDWRDEMMTMWPEYIGHVAGRCGETNDKAILKAARNEIKNDFVFASFFGATADSCARNLGAPVELMRELQGKFWKKFRGVADWHKQRRAEYRDTGASRIVTGQNRHELMKGNEPINSPVQGCEAMIVLDALNACAALARQTGDMYYHPRIEIHDDLTFILPDDDARLNHYIDTIVPIMTTCRYPWQILPWTVEAQIGTTWDNLQEFAVFEGDYYR